MSDAIVDRWVKGLPGGNGAAIVSLLGKKPDGMSEFAFYSFAGAREVESAQHRGPSFQGWLTKRHPKRGIVVMEHPTTDLRLVETETVQAVGADIECLLRDGRTVILVDSGGETRSRFVLRKLGFVEDTRA